jgi:hypothetical protein
MRSAGRSASPTVPQAAEPTQLGAWRGALISGRLTALRQPVRGPGDSNSMSPPSSTGGQGAVGAVTCGSFGRSGPLMPAVVHRSPAGCGPSTDQEGPTTSGMDALDACVLRDEERTAVRTAPLGPSSGFSRSRRPGGPADPTPRGQAPMGCAVRPHVGSGPDPARHGPPLPGPRPSWRRRPGPAGWPLPGRRLGWR